MRTHLAASNADRSYSLAATSIAIFTFVLFFLHPRLAGGEVSPLLLQGVLAVLGFATFSFGIGSFYYYSASLEDRTDDAERDRWFRRGDCCWLLGCVLLFAAPSLVLFLIGLFVVAATWLVLWVVYVFFLLRCFPRVHAAPKRSGG